MPIMPSDMAIDAKIEHHAFPNLITLAATAASEQPAIYDPSREITIVDIYWEVDLAAAASATAQLGTIASAALYGTVAIATSDAAGSFVKGTPTAAANRIAAGTQIVGNHIDVGTAAGTGYLHVFYIRHDNDSAVGHQN